MRLRIRHLTVCVLLVALGACADLFGPGADVTVYALRSINGDRVPMSVPPSFGGYTQLADTIRLDRSGAGNWVMYHEWGPEALIPGVTAMEFKVQLEGTPVAPRRLRRWRELFVIPPFDEIVSPPDEILHPASARLGGFEVLFGDDRYYFVRVGSERH